MNNFIPSKFCANYLPDGNDGNNTIYPTLFFEQKSTEI